MWLEVTNLVIPTLNDDPRMVADMVRWMVANLGPDTPLHLSRFTPRYRLRNLPHTPETTLNELGELAREEGLHHVYLGNLLGTDRQSTYCSGCHKRLVERRGYVIGENLLGETGGLCPHCETRAAGVWI